MSLHNIVRKHTLVEKDGVGVFWLCSSRVPVVGRVQVQFRPDIADSGWHYVPAFEDPDGTLLFEKMIGAAGPEEAMNFLREVMEKIGASDEK